MKHVLLAVALLFCLPSFGFDSGEVELRINSQQTVSAGATALEFSLYDKQSARDLTPSNLVISHERILHMLIYDPSLTQFQHVHPEFIDGKWKVELSFAVNGNYFVWAQGVIGGVFDEFSSLSRLEVINGELARPIPTSLGDVRNGVDSGSVATMTDEVLKVGSKLGPKLLFTREDGSPAEVTPYLGAFAHVIAVPLDGSDLVHVHPQNGQFPNEGVVHFRFETPGPYRVWVQFIDAGILKTVAMSVIAY